MQLPWQIAQSVSWQQDLLFLMKQCDKRCTEQTCVWPRWWQLTRPVKTSTEQAQCQRGAPVTTLRLCNVSVQSQATESNQNSVDWTGTKQNPVSQEGWPPCNPLQSPETGCSLDPPGSGKPSGSLGWHGQTELGQRGPADQPGCLDLRYRPGKQPINGEKKKTILIHHANSV